MVSHVVGGSHVRLARHENQERGALTVGGILQHLRRNLGRGLRCESQWFSEGSVVLCSDCPVSNQKSSHAENQSKRHHASYSCTGSGLGVMAILHDVRPSLGTLLQAS